MLLRLSSAQVEKHPAFIYRLEVANEGKSQARKCEAVIEGLWQADAAGEYKPFPRYTPVSLIWGSGNEDVVDINPGRRLYCDLFTVPAAPYQRLMRGMFGAYIDPQGTPEFDVGLVLCVKSAFFSQPNRLPAGRYRIALVIYSENAPTARQSLYVAWTGEWRDSEEDMFRACVLAAAERGLANPALNPTGAPRPQVNA